MKELVIVDETVHETVLLFVHQVLRSENCAFAELFDGPEFGLETVHGFGRT